MAVKNFEVIKGDDVTTTRTLLHEAIPLTGTILSGTYEDENIKDFTHGMFQSVYDYPYLSSSSNHIFDITACYAASSSYSASGNTQNAKKINQYTLFAQTLLGYTGSLTEPSKQVRLFENDLTLDLSMPGQMKEVFILSFSRLLVKDQIKKGSFSMMIGTGTWGPANSNPFLTEKYYTLSDASASADGTGVASVLGGDMGLLYSNNTNAVSGAIFYQAGIVVLSASCFHRPDGTPIAQFNRDGETIGYQTPLMALTGASISGSCDAVRRRVSNISFNNTTEINSKIYFCRVPHNKYNYSSNPTYLSGSKIRVKNTPSDQPVSYITTVGLYNDAQELLAVAKLSEPIRKDPTNDITIRVRLDY
mgnify:FL=1